MIVGERLFLNFVQAVDKIGGNFTRYIDRVSDFFLRMTCEVEGTRSAPDFGATLKSFDQHWTGLFQQLSRRSAVGSVIATVEKIFH